MIAVSVSSLRLLKCARNFSQLRQIQRSNWTKHAVFVDGMKLLAHVNILPRRETLSNHLIRVCRRDKRDLPLDRSIPHSWPFAASRAAKNRFLVLATTCARLERMR